MVCKVILDTNVLISALITRNSNPYNIIFECILVEKTAKLCLSNALLQEYSNVVIRPKFNKNPDFIPRALALLKELNTIADNFAPAFKLSVISDDPDNRLLELAVVSKADYIITGNTNDFNFSEYQGTKIISPKDFYELCTQKTYKFSNSPIE